MPKQSAAQRLGARDPTMEAATMDIGYHGGLRYPHLETIVTGAASMDAI